MRLQGTQLPLLDKFPHQLSNNDALVDAFLDHGRYKKVIYQLFHTVFLTIYFENQQIFKNLLNSPYLLSLLAYIGWLVGNSFILSKHPSFQATKRTAIDSL